VRVWGKIHAEQNKPATVASAAVEGKTRQELVRQAVGLLLASGAADRVGVWLDSPMESPEEFTEVRAFRGIVAEKEKDATPPEWSRLAPQPPLPDQLLTSLQTVEQELGNSREALMIGALLEMRRVLWVPIKTHGQLRGVAFAASRRKQAHLPRALLESVAAELALTIHLDDERSLGRERQADSRRTLAILAGSESPSTILTTVVTDCTQITENHSGPTAVFAAIGRRPATKSSSHSSEQTIRFYWQSGAAHWIRALDSEELRSVWQRALESRQVVGSAPGHATSLGQVARVVALPLLASGESLGVLVVGLRQGAASLATLDRLELSAALAASALQQLGRGEEAAEQELHLNDLLAAVGAATVVVRADGTVAHYSDSARALLEAPKKGFATDPAETFLALFSEDNIPAVKDWLQKARSSQQHQQSLSEGHLHNGTRVRLQTLGFASDGNIGVLLDRLPERGEQTQFGHGIPEILHVIEWLEEGVVLFGANHEIRAVNSRFAQIVGLTADELTRVKTLDDLITLLGSRTAAPGAFAESWHSLARSTEGAARHELQLVHPYSRLLERATRPILDAKGALLGRVEIYRDLTAQRVFQSKLLQTDKLAELGQMVTGIAHELSNPLTSILGYAQRLLLRRDSAGDSQEARQIFQEAERASGILRQLLLSARENRPERRRIALNQIVSRTLELQHFSLAADNIHVQLDLEPVLPFVQGDSGQLQQVLMNLLGNARQAIEEQGKGGTIRIKTMRVSEKRVLLEVSDDGPGIPQAIQARIFDPFFTTKPPGVGTGLGLSIVLGIVREHGGHLHLISNLGQGTTFSIELPALATSEIPSADTAPFSIRPNSNTLSAPDYRDGDQSAAALDPWAGTRVLVLEDEPTVARLIADVLEDAGLRVDVLLDSREALDRACRKDYAMVICDMKMPELDGEHFYQALVHAKHPLRDRFLFVTGDVLAAHTRDFLERNHLPYVAKPFRVEELTEKIHAVLEHTSPREPSPVSAAKNAARS